MTNRPEIVIKGTFDNWPGGSQTLIPLDPAPRPRPATLQFGAQVEPAGRLVWFRIDADDIRLLREDTPQARGALLVNALIVWLNENPDHQLDAGNTFHVLVCETGDVKVEPARDDE